MWVISAPFDAESPKNDEARLEARLDFQSVYVMRLVYYILSIGCTESKLLKPNSSYILGRKDRALVINNKRMSQDHCEFVVGDHTIDDTVNTRCFWPVKLECNTWSSARAIHRPNHCSKW